ncbi:MAG: nucleoside hydrolase [Streptosporangiales bacterium]
MTAKILIDCDPGIDDALAIALAAGASELDIVGITTVAGNVTLDKTTANALQVCDYLGLSDVPIVAGSATPLLRNLVVADDVHGESGLGGVALPQPQRRHMQGHAADFIAETVRSAPGEITLVAIGPLTNIALAVRRDPEIVRLVREFVIMGGAATVPGNLTPAAEFNIAVDPEAAAIAFDAGWTTTMVGLDVTRKARADAAAMERMRGYGPLSDDLLVPCLEFYTGHPAHSAEGPAVHDACAVAYVARPELLECHDARVEVETTGRLTYGMTVTDLAAPATACNARVALGVDAPALWSLVDTAYTRLVHGREEPARP